jgi:hypothetical protein
MKEFFRKNWKEFLCIVVAAALSDSVLDWLGWSHSFLSYLGVFIGIFIIAAILIALVELLIKTIRK